MITRALTRAFIDAGYVIALLQAEDPYNDVAARWPAVIQREGWRLTVTTAVLAEIGNAFAKQWYRVSDYLRAAMVDPTLEIVAVTDDLFRRALDLRNQRTDKEWGLTDCISFVVMQDRGLRDALAADRHFEQAGFRALLGMEPPVTRARP